MKKPPRTRPRPRLSRTRLDAMVEQAIVDAYGESEQAVGLFTMMEENLQMPFETMLLGVPVTVERVDLNDGENIVAICRRGRVRQEPVREMSVASAVRPKRERERRKTARRRSPATPHKRISEHSARSESIAGAQQEMTRTGSLAVPILDLPLPRPRPGGWEWIEAFRHWSRGR